MPGVYESGREKVVISYIGSISNETQCKQLIDLVEKDDRFIFRFYGNEANGTEVSEYVRRVHNDRIQMMGAFPRGIVLLFMGPVTWCSIAMAMKVRW